MEIEKYVEKIIRETSNYWYEEGKENSAKGIIDMIEDIEFFHWNEETQRMIKDKVISLIKQKHGIED